MRAEFQQILKGGCLIEGEFVADGETAATKEGCGGSCYCEYGRVVCSDSYSSMRNSDSTGMKETQSVPECSKETNDGSHHLDYYCKPEYENPEACGKEPVCCEALISSCLACAANMSEEDYCEQNPFTAGCTFSSVSSFARMSEEQCDNTGGGGDDNTKSELLQQLLEANGKIADANAE